MQTLTQQLIDQGLANRVLTEMQLARLLEGSPQRRYNLVNRALKAEELLRLSRGIYVLSNRYRNQTAHPFALAQALAPGSYVSFESALAHHGWIPEAVYTTTSVIPGRKSKDVEHESMGRFSFYPLAIQKGYFLELVDRLQLNGQTMLVAKPIRALMDLVCQKKCEWQGLEWFEENLRIEDENLRSVTMDDIRILKLVYKQKRVITFLEAFAESLAEALAKELGND